MICERLAAEGVRHMKREVYDAQKRLDEEDHRSSEFKRRNIEQLPEGVAANLAMLERLNAELALDNHTRVIAVERGTALRRRSGEPDLPVAAPTPGEVLKIRVTAHND